MTTPEPAATVIVPTRGGRDRVLTLLRLLEAQDTDDLEVVVVVDGDVDDTTGAVASRASTVPVRVITFPENRGRSAALNAGVAAARGRVVIRCDDDLEPGATFVGAHVAAHGDGVVGVVGLYRNVFPDTPYARAYGRTADERFRDAAYATAADTTWRYWAGNVSVTRETAERVGPYDEAFRAYGWEDVDWGYRLHLLGVPVVLEPRLETTHRLSAVTARSRVERAFFSGAARRQFVAKHGVRWLEPTRPTTPWQAAVRLVAAVLTEGGSRRAGALADRAAGVLPARAGRALVGLLVEAAGDAGYRRGRVSDPTAV
ncbi:glycosyltransferase family 2 protein [Oryzobacter sp. R7]|uniref:glycosyltransferase family 2 protein n=1 Tax=Oryzobacter faecalis TaxID=3388656 RepID=UPI00398D321A